MDASASAAFPDPVRLVAVDMDGTFLDSNSTYDRERFARVHARLTASGIRFAVASGNQYWQLRSYFEGVDDVLFIAENGSMIATADRVLRLSPIEPDALGDTLALLEGLPEVFTLVCGARSAYALRSMDPDVVAFMRHYYRRLEIVESWADIDDDVVKLALGCPPKRTASLLGELAIGLPTGVVAVSSGHGSIDLISREVNKGVALVWLGEQLGIAPEEMVAFGDGGNDVEMLRVAGLGVAMANAPGEIREIADVVAGGNDEAGVLEFLERMLDGGPALASSQTYSSKGA